LLKNSSLYREFQAEPSEILRHKWIESEKKPDATSASSSADGLDHQHRSTWRKNRQAAARN